MLSVNKNSDCLLKPSHQRRHHLSKPEGNVRERTKVKLRIFNAFKHVKLERWRHQVSQFSRKVLFKRVLLMK